MQNPIAEIAEENGEAGAVIEEVAEEGNNPEENSVADGTDAMDDATVDAQALDAAEVLHFSADTGLLWPMEGNVILNYSMDSTVYFATLDQYKYNPAVLISGNVNDKVVAVAKGKISKLSNLNPIELFILKLFKSFIKNSCLSFFTNKSLALIKVIFEFA